MRIEYNDVVDFLSEFDHDSNLVVRYRVVSEPLNDGSVKVHFVLTAVTINHVLGEYQTHRCEVLVGVAYGPDYEEPEIIQKLLEEVKAAAKLKGWQLKPGEFTG